MKHKLQIISSTFAASILAFSAPAQDSLQQGTVQSGQHQSDKSNRGRPDRLNSAVKVTDVIGMTVNNYQSEKLGKVEEVALDVESGRIVQVILSTGGFLGIGDTLTGLPPGALHHDVAAGVMHLDATRDKIKDAPRFDMTKWEECCDQEQLTKVYRHYGAEPGQWFGERDGRTYVRGASKDTESNVNAVRGEARDKVSDLSDNVERSANPTSRLGSAMKASRLMGMPVINRQDQSLGKVENLLLDLPAGRVVAVVVSSGGFIGIGDELSAVPPAALRFSEDQYSLVLDASKELLTQAPHFTSNRWPDFSQAGYSEGVYRAFNVQPYFTTNEVTEPDNTALNVRDRNDRNPTAFDQGNSSGDVDITARIRQGIVDNKDMSVNARNVKVITRDGQVTLRGPVSTAEEKRMIGEIAIKNATLGNVRNEIEVK